MKPINVAAAAAAVIVVASVFCIFASFLLREYSEFGHYTTSARG
jgi:hypothetical protein